MVAGRIKLAMKLRLRMGRVSPCAFQSQESRVATMVQAEERIMHREMREGYRGVGNKAGERGREW